MNQTPVIIPGCGEGDVFLRSRRTKMHFKTKMMKLLLVVSAIVAVPVLGCAVVRYLLHPLAILSGALFCTFLYAIWRYHLEKKVFLLIFPPKRYKKCKISASFHKFAKRNPEMQSSWRRAETSKNILRNIRTILLYFVCLPVSFA